MICDKEAGNNVTNNEPILKSVIISQKDRYLLQVEKFIYLVPSRVSWVFIHR